MCAFFSLLGSLIHGERDFDSGGYLRSMCLPWLRDLWFCSVVSEKQLSILLEIAKYQFGAGAVVTL